MATSLEMHYLSLEACQLLLAGSREQESKSQIVFYFELLCPSPHMCCICLHGPGVGKVVCFLCAQFLRFIDSDPGKALACRFV